jgi:hypothetical protein
VVHFRDAKVEEMQALLPAPRSDATLLPIVGLSHPV